MTCNKTFLLGCLPTGRRGWITVVDLLSASTQVSMRDRKTILEGTQVDSACTMVYATAEDL